MDAFTKQCAEALPYIAEKLYQDFGIKVELKPYNNDLVTPIGDLPRGIAIELFGEESVGKTTIALAIVSELQKQGKNILYVDLSKTLYPHYLEKMGITDKGLMICKPLDPEEAMVTTINMVSSGIFDLVIVDSVYHIPAHILTKYLNQLIPMLGKARTTVIFLNEHYKTIYNKFVTTGGDALKSLTSIRLHVSLKKEFKNVDGHYGNRVIIKSVKDRHGFTYTEREYKIYFGKGIVHENRERS